MALFLPHAYMYACTQKSSENPPESVFDNLKCVRKGRGWARRVSESDVTVGAACGGEKCHFVFGVYVEYTFAWSKTLPVPNPRTGNRRPFQFLLLSAQV